MNSIKCLAWELGIEFEIALTGGGELNFDKSSPHFNVKKKHIQVTFNLTVNLEY